MLSVFGLLLGMPPSPADPVVERAAPEECLYYLGWNGMAAPATESKNRTERFLADPGLREFVDQLGAQITGALRQKAKGQVEAEIVAEVLPGLLKTLATHPAAIYLGEA